MQQTLQETARLLGLCSLMLFIYLLSLAVLLTLITSIGAILFCLTAAVAVFIYSISSIISQPKQSSSQPKQSDSQPKQSDSQPKQSGSQPKQSDSQPQQSGSEPKQSGINKCCSICHVLCLVAIPPLFLVILVLGTVIYLRLVMTSIDTTSVAGIIASFIPTAVLTVIGWVVGGKVLVGGVGGEGEGASQDTPRRVYNFIKHLVLKSTSTHQKWEELVDLGEDCHQTSSTNT